MLYWSWSVKPVGRETWQEVDSLLALVTIQCQDLVLQSWMRFLAASSGLHLPEHI